MNDNKFVKLAIEKSKESFDKGLFPAGAVVAKGDEVFAEEISGKYPKSHEHADYKSLDTVINKVGKQLKDFTLYCSMEPCLMCLSKAHWTGIRRIVFVVSRGSTKQDYFEGEHDSNSIVDNFNEEIEMIHFEDLEDEALDVVQDWESKGGFSK